MDEQIKEFEQSVNKHGFLRATVKFYKSNARTLALSIVSLAIILGLVASSIPVWQRAMIVLGLLAVNQLYKTDRWQLYSSR